MHQVAETVGVGAQTILFAETAPELAAEVEERVEPQGGLAQADEDHLVDGRPPLELGDDCCEDVGLRRIVAQPQPVPLHPPVAAFDFGQKEQASVHWLVRLT